MAAGTMLPSVAALAIVVGPCVGPAFADSRTGDTVHAVQRPGSGPSITTPVAGTVWKLGGKGLINWTPGGSARRVGLYLVKGSAAALQNVATIAKRVDVNARTYTWNVPANLTPGTDYAIGIGNPPNLLYTYYFTINATGKPAARTASHSRAPSRTREEAQSSGKSAAEWPLSSGNATEPALDPTVAIEDGF